MAQTQSSPSLDFTSTTVECPDPAWQKDDLDNKRAKLGTWAGSRQNMAKLNLEHVRASHMIGGRLSHSLW